MAPLWEGNSSIAGQEMSAVFEVWLSVSECDVAGIQFHSHPSSVDVKNEWGNTSTPPLRIHGVPRETLFLPVPRFATCVFLFNF